MPKHETLICPIRMSNICHNKRQISEKYNNALQECHKGFENLDYDKRLDDFCLKNQMNEFNPKEIKEFLARKILSTTIFSDKEFSFSFLDFEAFRVFMGEEFIGYSDVFDDESLENEFDNIAQSYDITPSLMILNAQHFLPDHSLAEAINFAP